ncbi:MAG: alpha/beta fold hydrolase [Planctomycetes bacterium]|nr:alpha/beta fold hydrolase [Planctomycetota bacterium]
MSLGTTFFVASVPVLGVILLWLRRWRLRASVRAIGLYLVGLAAMLGGALLIVAYIAGARVPPIEFVVVLWFAISLRLAWELWSRTIGRAGQRWVRWARRRRRSRRSAPLLVRLIPAARISATLAIFAPAALAFTLTHRFKLLDGHTPREALAMKYEPVRIPTADGMTLDGWFVPCDGATGTIVICHGAGANKGNFVWFLAPLNYHGYNLLMFDFRAHGASDGRICTYGLLEKRDVRAAVAWLKHERPAQSTRIVGLGSSLGAMALALAAAEEPAIDAIVLDSPFVSPRELARHHLSRAPLIGTAFADLVLWHMSWMTGADFLHDSAEPAVAAIAPRPTLIIHGDDDRLMPASHSLRLYDSARGPRGLWMGPGPHSNIITTAPEEYAERLFAFLEKPPDAEMRR